MFNSLLTIFSYEFMQHALIAGTIAAILAGIVGYYVLIRQLAFAAHALGHIGFAGASGALLLSLTPMLGQFILTIFAALTMGLLGEKISKSDMAIGIILCFCLGLGSLFLYFYNGYAGGATIILFGNLLGVSKQDLYWMLFLMVASLFFLGLISKRLLFSSLEPELAEAKGISLFWMNMLFILIMAVAVTLTSQVVGIILVFTLLIGPAAISIQWTRRFWAGITTSVLLAVLIVWTGIYLSFVSDWPISFWISTIVFIFYSFTKLAVSQIHYLRFFNRFIP
jgi:zinc/manganese transport system permease protein